MRSFVAAGHDVELFTYGDVGAVPDGVTLRDGRDILPEDRLVRYRRSGSYALFSDLFRYVMIEREGGIYTDVDVVCHRPLDYAADDYVVGYQDHRMVNCAIYGAPRGSPLATFLRDIALEPPFLPFWATRATLVRVFGRLIVGRYQGFADAPWGTFGPQLMTAAVRRCGLGGHVATQDVLYPVGPAQAKMLLGPKEDVEALFTAKTRAVHLWNQILGAGARPPYPKGSYLEAMAARYL